MVYRVIAEDGTSTTSPTRRTGLRGNREIYEPIVKCTIIVPSEFVGTTMELCQSKRGEMKGMDYLSQTRVELRYVMPMGEIIFDFFDSLKSRTKGYASMDYEEAGEQLADLVKVDILLQGEAVDAFSAIVHRDHAQAYGNKMTVKLKELIPRQQYEVPVQAAIGSKIIARENIRAIRKDVLSKCYGGDISRKRKLLEKQKEGKKRAVHRSGGRRRRPSWRRCRRTVVRTRSRRASSPEGGQARARWRRTADRLLQRASSRPASVAGGVGEDSLAIIRRASGEPVDAAFGEVQRRADGEHGGEQAGEAHVVGTVVQVPAAVVVGQAWGAGVLGQEGVEGVGAGPGIGGVDDDEPSVEVIVDLGQVRVMHLAIDRHPRVAAAVHEFGGVRGRRLARSAARVTGSAP